LCPNKTRVCLFSEFSPGELCHREITNPFYTVSMEGAPRIKCGALVREARRRHGLDQKELARRAGTEQPAISRIERDAVSPSLATLNRLFEAMGETLVAAPMPLRGPVPGGGNQSIAELRSDYRDLTPEERLAQAAQLSEIATELAAGSEA
jgi:transcriptional regulator with XRE-family HTH domain